VRRFLAAFAVLAALAPGTAHAIVGGSQASSIAQFPFQVELWNQLGNNPVNGFFCGGVILDSQHVATAAHCVFDDSTGQATPPSRLHVLAGTSDLQAAGTDVVASATSFDPNYDPSTNDYDMGVLTLSQPLYTVPSATIAPVTPIGVGDPTHLTDEDDPVTTSGWGYDLALGPDEAPDPNHASPTKLRWVQVKVNETGLSPDNGTCASHYLTIGLTETPRMLCASDTNKDSCYGDSGGPLVTGTAPANYKLAGLVESGAGCAQAAFPGIYDRMSNAAVQGFLLSKPPQAPQQQSATTIAGTPAAGGAVTCQPGAWSDSPSFLYEFFKDLGSQGVQLLAGPSADATYTVKSSDVGSQIFCIVKASNAGGYGFGVSPDVTGAAPAIVTPPPTAVDSTRPVLGVVRKSCTSRGRCVVNVVVSDASPSSGIAKVAATLRWRTVVACKSAKRRCTKMKTKTLRAKAIGGDHYLITATRLKPGAYTLLLTAYDKAGNKQRQPTRMTLRVTTRR
jgi:secreted trypsin-like serine protease